VPVFMTRRELPRESAPRVAFEESRRILKPPALICVVRRPGAMNRKLVVVDGRGSVVRSQAPSSAGQFARPRAPSRRPVLPGREHLAGFPHYLVSGSKTRKTTIGRN